MVSADVPERLEELALDEHGVAGRAEVRGADRRGLAVARVDHPPDRVRRHARLVAERDHNGLAVREPGEPARERGGQALVPALAGARLRAVEVHGGGDLLHESAEHHDNASHRCGRHRPHGVLQQRPAVELRELLAPAEARAGARGEDERRPITRPPRGSGRADWDRRPPSRPFRTATTSDMIESAVSSGLTAPRSRPIGAATRSSSASSSPAASSRSRRCACARRLPIAPTYAASDCSAIDSAASSSFGSCVSTAM